MAEGAGRMNSGTSKTRTAASHSANMPAMTSQGSQASRLRRRRAAAAMASARAEGAAGGASGSRGIGRQLRLALARRADPVAQVVRQRLELGQVGGLQRP